MLLRAVFFLAMAACPVLAGAPRSQSAGSAADVVVEMRATEQRVASDLSRNEDYAALKTRQADLGAQLENCADKDRSALAAQKSAVTQQIDAMEKAELAKDEHYSALSQEYDRLAAGALSVADGATESRSVYRASDRYRYARLRLGTHKSSLIGVQTFTFQQ